MNRIKKIITIAIIIFTCLALFVGCDKDITENAKQSEIDSNSTNTSSDDININDGKYNVYFYCEGIGIVSTYRTAGNEIIPLPYMEDFLNKSKFCGWYWDNGFYEHPFTNDSLLNILLVSDIQIYAKILSEEEQQAILKQETINNMESELKEKKGEYDNAVIAYNSAKIEKETAYNDYLNKMQTYNSIIVNKIQVYRSGRGFVYEDDPSALSRKESARRAADLAKQYYDICVEECNQAKIKMDEKYQEYISYKNQLDELR